MGLNQMYNGKLILLFVKVNYFEEEGGKYVFRSIFFHGYILSCRLKFHIIKKHEHQDFVSNSYPGRWTFHYFSKDIHSQKVDSHSC